MTPEQIPSIDRAAYEAWLYGHAVYWAFAAYCHWRTVVRTQDVWWRDAVPAYYRGEGTVAPED
jgi:hypothetical protein